MVRGDVMLTDAAPVVLSDGRMITGLQIRAARAILRWSADDLAEACGVGVATIRRAEASEGVPSVNARTLARIQAALENGGVVVIDDSSPSPSGGPGVRLRG